MRKTLGLTLAVGIVSLANLAGAQTVEEFITPDEDGIHFRYRVDPGDPPVMIPLPATIGTSGYTGDAGKVWMAFTRFGINNSLLPSGADPAIPYDTLANASKIVLKTGVCRMEYSRLRDSELGGTFGDFYLIPDHYTFFGYDLDSLKAMEFFLVPWHPDAYHVQEFDPTQYVEMPGADDATRDQFNLDVDITAAVKQAISDGKLTNDSASFSIAYFPNEVVYYNPDTGAYNQDDPNYAPHRNWAWKMRANGGDPSYLEVTTGGEGATWNGYPVDESGWADTTPWLQWVNVSFDPWIWVESLGKYVYVEGDTGWVYVP